MSVPETVDWETYVKAQKGLCALASAYDHVVSSAICAASAHCAWDQNTVERLQENTSKRLRGIIAVYALEHENLDQLGVSALGQVVVYLIQQKESRPLLRSICEEQQLRYDPQDETLLRNLRVRAVSRLLADFETLRAPKCPFDDVVECAICAASVHCGWEQQTVDRLRDDTSQQLRGVIAQYAQEHENLNQLGVFALEQVVGYLIERRESDSWGRYVCHDLQEHPEPKSKSPPSPLQKQIVDRAMKAIAKDYPTPPAPGASGAWASVRAVYGANAINEFTTFLLGKCRQLIGKFQKEVTPFCEARGVTAEDVEQILRSGFAQAMVRYEPGRSRCSEGAERIDPAFLTTALRGMQNVFWTDPEILRGCPQDLFRLIGVIWKREQVLVRAPAGSRPTPEDIAASINQSGGFKGARLTAEKVNEALAVARTMAFESLEVMANRYVNDDGDTSEIDPLAEGPLASEAAKTGGTRFPDPAEQVERNDFVRKFEALAKKVLSPEQYEAFASRVVDDEDWAEIAAKLQVTPRRAQDLYQQARTSLGPHVDRLL